MLPGFASLGPKAGTKHCALLVPVCCCVLLLQLVEQQWLINRLIKAALIRDLVDLQRLAGLEASAVVALIVLQLQGE
jgi:hypothetical protein